MVTIQVDANGKNFVEVDLFAGETLIFTQLRDGPHGLLTVCHTGVAGNLGPAFELPVRHLGRMAGAVYQLLGLALENQVPHVELRLPGGQQLLRATALNGGFGNPYRLRLEFFDQGQWQFLGQEIPSDRLADISDAIIQLLSIPS